MLIRGLVLAPPNCAYHMVLRGTRGAFQLIAHVAVAAVKRRVKTALVEGVFTQEVDRGKVETHSTGVAALGLEYGRLRAQIGNFGGFLCGFEAVGLDHVAVLLSFSCELGAKTN